jgi:pimeloyl-ACP methyl ester carboxylesterase
MLSVWLKRTGSSAIARHLGWLGLALVLALPTLAGGRTVAATSLFLAEFLSDGRLRALSALTPAPLTEPLREGGFVADLHQPLRLTPPSPLVLVHGLSPEGKDNPQLRQAARLLARSGFAVAVPTVPGLVELRLRPEDAEPVVAAIHAVAERISARSVAVFGVSVGAGPALLAAADPRVADRVSVVLSLGGYASTVELLRYFLTGHYRFGSVAGRVAPNPEGARLFLRANLDLVENPGDRKRLAAWLDTPGAAAPAGLSAEAAAVAALVENRDPARVEPLINALPPALRHLLDALAPERVVPRLKGRLILVHGRNDPAVPFTESLRLAEAARRAGVPSRLVVIRVVEHVEAGEAQPLSGGQLLELAHLWTSAYDLFSAH